MRKCLDIGSGSLLSSIFFQLPFPWWINGGQSLSSECYCVSLTKLLIVLCFPSAGCFKNILLSLTSCKCMENMACKINHKSPFFPPLLFSFETFRVRCIVYVAFGLPRWLSRWRICLQCRSCRGCRFNPWVRKIPWRRSWQPSPVFLPGKFHEQRNLVDCSTWGRWVGHHRTGAHILCLVLALLLWRWDTKFLLCYNRK